MEKNFNKSVINNKRQIYFFGILFLMAFCLILNNIYNLFRNNTNNIKSNIIVDNLEYKLVVNNFKDNVILSKSKNIEKFDISLLSLNDFDTKYEIIYKVCKDITCKEFIDEPNNFEIVYNENESNITGIITAETSKSISIVVYNETNNDYYVQIGLNATNIKNNLALQNQITNSYLANYNNSNINILAYVEGKLATSFPADDNFTASVVCKDNNGTELSSRGIFKYSSTTGWQFNVYDISLFEINCRVDFEKMSQVTYSMLAGRYNCNNKQDKVENPIISYSGNCLLYQDTNSADWYMKLTSNGTLNVAGKLWLDVFLVGGGAGGSKGYNGGGAGGGGGKTYTGNNIVFSNTSSYTVTIGAGGTGGSGNTNIKGTAGGATSIKMSSSSTLTAAGGTIEGGGYGGRGQSVSGGAGSNGVRAFGGTIKDTLLYGAGGGGGGSDCGGINPWPGGGGAGGTTGAGSGGRGNGSDSGATAGTSANTANVGAGGGGGGAGNYQPGGNGGTGVAIIRNKR